MSLFDNIPEGTDIIEVRKKVNKMLSEARKKAKPPKCILCGKEQSSFCNSHSVPQMCLRPIADRGKVLHASLAMGFDIGVVDLDGGVNKSGTFNYICRECDAKFFQDYENPDNIIHPPTDKFLAEIAVKNMLLQLSKRANEQELIPVLQRELGMYENPDDLSKIKTLDQKEYEEEVLFHQDIAKNNKVGGYQILFWKVLPYKVPIATQSAIVLPYDMEGNILNEIYNFDESVRMQYMHIAVFPLEDESVVLAFYHKRDKLYRQLRHQINSSSQEKVLQYINYLIFEHTENVYFSKKIEEEIKNNKMIEKLSQEANGLRKYDYNREDVYLSNVFDAIDKMYPEVGENINILREKFEKLNNYYMEVILSDGTSLNLYKAIEDVMYGLYLHADPDKIERLLKTNKNVYLMAVKEYITVLEGIVVDTYNSIADKM